MNEIKQCASNAQRTCYARHLIDPDDKEEGERLVQVFNDTLIKNVDKTRKENPDKYPKILGISVFSDDVALNKLHKEHQIALLD